jgi:hypothetical protein
VNDLAISVPAGATVGATFTRFRVTSGAGYSYTGLAPDGEVEDYGLTITAASSSLLRPSFAALTNPLIADSSESTKGRSGTTKPITVVSEPPRAAVVDQAISEMESASSRSRLVADSLSLLDEYLVDEVIAAETGISL